MQVIRIAKNKLELSTVLMDQPLISVGRSSACDVVLAAPGVTAKNYLIRWVGEGPFDKTKGSWQVVDLSPNNATPGTPVNPATAPGVPLGDGVVTFNGLNFSIIEDRLISSDFDGPLRAHLAQTIKAMNEGMLSAVRDSSCLEIVEFNSQLSAVLSVQHFFPGPAPARLRCFPKVKVSWESPQVAAVFLSSRFQHQAFLNGKPIPPGSKKVVRLEVNSFLQIDSEHTKAIIRMVPPIDGHEVERQPLHKKPWAWFLLCISATIVFLGFWRMIAEFRPPPPAPPKLTAQVEIKLKAPPEIKKIPEAKPVPEPTAAPIPVVVKPPPPPPPAPAPAPAPPKVAEVVPPKPKPAPPAPPIVAKANKPVVTTPPPVVAKAPKANPRPKAAPKDQMWLLSAISKGRGKEVKADALTNQGLQSQKREDETISLQKPQIDTNLSADPGTRKQLRELADDSSVGKTASNLFKGSKPGSSKGISGSSASLANELASGDGTGTVDFQQARMSGGLTRAQVLKPIEKRRSMIKECYDKALLQNAKVNGRVVFQWIISPTGSVKSLKLTETQAKFPALEDCVKGVLEALTFPAAANGKSTLVDYPFIFHKTK